MSELDKQMEVVAKVLWRCFVLGALFLVLWSGVFLAPGNLIYRIHGGLFDLTEHELQLIHYCGMGLVKAQVLVAFFFPWLAIRWVLRSRQSV